VDFPAKPGRFINALRVGLKNRISLLFASGLGLGYLPGPTGTYGSALGLLIWWVAASWQEPVLECLIAAAFLIFSVPAASRAENLLHRDDPGEVVCDEVSGQLIALLFLPFSGTVALAAFLLFRAFDIVKPYPVNRLELLPRGWGIVADDVMAGVYANVVLRFLLYMDWLPMALS
jgi:phosphatidylglycerophosphatase A